MRDTRLKRMTLTLAYRVSDDLEWEFNGKRLPFIWANKEDGSIQLKIWGAMFGVVWSSETDQKE